MYVCHSQRTLYNIANRQAGKQAKRASERVKQYSRERVRLMNKRSRHARATKRNAMQCNVMQMVLSLIRTEQILRLTMGWMKLCLSSGNVTTNLLRT